MKDESSGDYDAYLTDGTPIPAYRNGLNFALPVDDANAHWEAGATLTENGYEFMGDSRTGYELKLGNLYLKTTGSSITLPNDGPVEVVLASGAYACLYTQDGTAAALFCDGGTHAPVTISGDGRLLLRGSEQALNVNSPLTITGGDIRAYGDFDDALSAAPSFTDYTPRVSYGESAATAATAVSPEDEVYTTNKYVKIEKYVAPSVSRYTLSFETNSGSAIAKIVKAKGTNLDLTAYAPTREGYIFAGWFSDAALTESVTGLALTKNTTVYTKWNADELPFADVTENDWFHGDVAYVYAEGLMQGTGETAFDPHGTTSRGMIVTVLYRLAGEPAVTGDCPFDDVEAGKYYENAVIWAAENKNVDGYSDGRFGSEDPVTREQLTTILYRYEQHRGGGFTGAWMFRLDFPDADQVSDWAYEAMCWCTMNGIIGGSDGGTLDPQGDAERCHVAAILHRFCENVNE